MISAKIINSSACTLHENSFIIKKIMKSFFIYEENIVIFREINYSIKLDPMKKTITLLLLIFPFLLPAQDFRYGIKAGMNQSTYRGETDGGLFKTEAYAGVFANYQFNINIGLQTELVYSRLGSRDTLSGNKINISLNYLQIPILFQYNLSNYEQFKFVLGPQLGYLLDSKLKVGSDTNHDKSLFEDFDYGAVVGLEYVESDHFIISLRYYLGFSEYYNQSKEDSAAKNSAFSLGLAYRF